MKIMCRQSEARMDKYIWDQVNDPKCGRIQLCISGKVVAEQWVREKLRELVGSNLMYISHPLKT